VLTPTVVELLVRPEPVTPDSFIVSLQTAAPSPAIVVKLSAPGAQTR